MAEDNSISEKDRLAAEAMEKMGLVETAVEVAKPSPEPVKFDEVKETAGAGQDKPQNIDFIMDIPLRVSVELGRTKILVGDLLRMSHGSVIELEKVAGEPMEVLVNDKLVAKGEVVLVNDKLGIRLTDIVSQTERIKKLS